MSLISSSILLLIIVIINTVNTTSIHRYYRDDDAILDYDGHQLICIRPMNDEQNMIVRQFEHDFMLDYWNPVIVDGGNHQQIMTVIEPLKRSEFLTKLNESNIEYDILIPQKAEKISLGYSYEKRNILGIKIGNNSDSRVIFVECGMHAREWISPAFCIWLSGQLLTNRQLSTYIDRYQFIIIPSVNVDGYVFTHTNQRLWRKTRSRQFGTNCVGADPNRNWNSFWCQRGSSSNPCSNTYCGRSPFSEIESKQMANLLERYQGKIFAYFAIHSYSQL
ncbi:hypothetical protein BLA29_004730, partial [Euroglyphus maynei]